MIEQQIDIPTKPATPPPSSPIPSAAARTRHPVLHGRAGDPRGAARHGPAARHVGYYVMLPNMYYRAGVDGARADLRRFRKPERKRMFELMNSLTIPLVMGDADALLARRRPGGRGKGTSAPSATA